MSESTSGKSMSCDREALDQFLVDKLTEQERLALENHLSDCTECRQALERLAAEPVIWADTREFLSSAGDPLDVADSTGTGDRAPRRSAAVSDPDVGTQSLFPFDPRILHPAATAPLVEQVIGFLSPTDDPRMLGRFGGYEIAGVIGCGGMGIVVKGLDVALNRYVAIKVLAPHLATSAPARQRFAREARAAAAVVHENVTAIHAVAEANGLPYLVMPYIRGSSLQKRLDAQGTFTTAEILRIGMQTAAALAAAHAQGLVHRDIKPANILLEDGVERLTITDFGLARAADDASLTRSGVIAGTPQFMSPEQARGEPLDARSDLFSLGSVLYTLCTGRPPFRAETAYGVLRRISDEPPRPIREINPDIPEWLASIVGKLHAKDPALRYQSAAEVSQLFEACLAHVQQPTAVPLPTSLPIPAATRIRNRGRIWRRLAAAGAICITIGICVYVTHKPPADDGGTDRAATGQSGADIAGGASNETGREPAADTDRTRWNDGTETEISNVAGEIDELESEQNEDSNSVGAQRRSGESK
jgi:serine/threonine-protein kinase